MLFGTTGTVKSSPQTTSGYPGSTLLESLGWVTVPPRNALRPPVQIKLQSVAKLFKPSANQHRLHSAVLRRGRQRSNPS